MRTSRYFTLISNVSRPSRHSLICPLSKKKKICFYRLPASPSAFGFVESSELWLPFFIVQKFLTQNKTSDGWNRRCGTVQRVSAQVHIPLSSSLSSSHPPPLTSLAVVSAIRRTSIGMCRGSKRACTRLFVSVHVTHHQTHCATALSVPQARSH